MGEKIVVGPFNKGLKNDRTAFNIDNDSFPTLINAYQWRGRIKRKRGTSLLGRLSRYLGTTDGAGSLTVTISPQPIAVGIASFVIGADVFVDPGGASPVTLLTNSSGTGLLDRTTGVLTIVGSIAATSVFYFPRLPVMGLEEFLTSSVQFPGTLAFDTKYSYNISTAFPYSIYDVSFYKNPILDPTLFPTYVAKATPTRTWWNGEDYQQFWTVNYQGALWATNGINVPFSVTKIGMQYVFISNFVIALVGPNPASAVITTSTPHGLTAADVGAFVFLNEIQGITGANFQTGFVNGVIDPLNFGVVLQFATLGGAYTPATGIVQFLTNRVDTAKDCIRWYDGDPTDGNATTPTLNGRKGWVNFCPPLSKEAFGVAEVPAAQYYLVGARMIVPFKDRLLFLGPVIQTSVAGSQIYLQDTVIYSQNGTPYYTASFTGDASLANTVFTPLLVPVNETATPNAYWEDQTGFGGYVSAGVDQPLLTVANNKDSLITGFNTLQAKLIYSGNDLIPFQFYLINSELGSGSTFSVINMDHGVLTRGSRGYLMTNQEQCVRMDLEIPDQVYEINLLEHGPERFCAQRDFINEWIYLTYTGNLEKRSIYKFPNQTLQYNYRDDSWAIFYESYTTYGAFRKQSGFTWSTVGTKYATWSSWNASWNAGTSTLLQPEVIAGNQQGYIVARDDGTNESNSLYIQNIASSIVTSPDHGLNNGDYIIISGVLGTIGAQVNGKIFSVSKPTVTGFTLNPTISSGTYLGGGQIKRMYVPYVQTKQFPASWGMSRKTRIGVQQYLLTTTSVSQIALLIFLSQNDESAYNNPEFPNPVQIVPSLSTVNNSLIYSTVLYTCPESTNLGLTAPNVNLQMPTAIQQQQIWHRINTSLIGDTVQLGFTMNDEQMRSFVISSSQFIITGAVPDADPTYTVLTVSKEFEVGTVLNISGVVGMTQLNGNNYYVVAASPTTVTIDVDSSGFTTYVSGGVASPVSPGNQFAEIELHGFIIDVTPSQVLA